MNELKLPSDLNKLAPNCGLVAIAVVAGISLMRATDAYQQANEMETGKAKTGNWKGRTFKEIREVALDEVLKIDYDVIEFGKEPLHKVVKQLESNKTYMVSTTGHIQVVRNGIVADQNGIVSIDNYWGSRKMVKSALLIKGKR